MNPGSSTRCWSSPTVSRSRTVLAQNRGFLRARLLFTPSRRSCRNHFIPSVMQFFSVGYVTTIIEDAKIYATHAKKSTVDADDIKLAIQCRMDQSFTSPPPRDVSLLPAQKKRRQSKCSQTGNVSRSPCSFSSSWRSPGRRTRPPFLSSNRTAARGSPPTATVSRRPTTG